MSKIKKEEQTPLPSEACMKDLTDKQRRGLIKLTHLEYIPDTQAELARALGVTERGLYTWWNDPRWCQAIHALIQKRRIKHLPAIENALIKRAKEGSYPHQRGFYKLIGEDIENPETRILNVGSINDLHMTPEERAWIRSIAEQKRASEQKSLEVEVPK